MIRKRHTSIPLLNLGDACSPCNALVNPRDIVRLDSEYCRCPTAERSIDSATEEIQPSGHSYTEIADGLEVTDAQGPDVLSLSQRLVGHVL
jgi:hypothetical protein